MYKAKSKSFNLEQDPLITTSFGNEKCIFKRPCSLNCIEYWLYYRHGGNEPWRVIAAWQKLTTPIGCTSEPLRFWHYKCSSLLFPSCRRRLSFPTRLNAYSPHTPCLQVCQVLSPSGLQLTVRLPTLPHTNNECK